MTANGETDAVPFTLIKGYQIEPYKESGMGNTPPTLTFVKGGPASPGPQLASATTLSGTRGAAGDADLLGRRPARST